MASSLLGASAGSAATRSLGGMLREVRAVAGSFDSAGTGGGSVAVDGDESPRRGVSGEGARARSPSLSRRGSSISNVRASSRTLSRGGSSAAGRVGFLICTVVRRPRSSRSGGWVAPGEVGGWAGAPAPQLAAPAGRTGSMSCVLRGPRRGMSTRPTGPAAGATGAAGELATWGAGPRGDGGNGGVGGGAGTTGRTGARGGGAG